MMLVGLVLLIVAVFLWGLGKVIVGLVKRRPRNVFGGLALIFGSLAAGSYAVAAVLVAIAAYESSHEAESPASFCRRALTAQATHIVGYQAHYLPPRFDCTLDDGTTISAGVVPKGTTVVILATAVLGAAAAVRSRPKRGRLHPEP
ncbi:hypothetical protein ACI2LF_14995 [Kribbella sp. NPDC020789]